jgi:hypothetical protein
MKLLIDEDLVFTQAFPPEFPEAEFDAECEYFQQLDALARQYAVAGSFAVTATGVTVIVRAQKVTLDEISMNTLFAEFLSELFIVELRYAALGGAGCDFAMSVVKAVPRSPG